jgi:hypothetical protein
MGSSDFEQLISSLDISRDYDRARSSGNRETNALRHMHEKVHRRILQFLLARFLLLNLLIEEASECEGGLRPSDHRLLWVLLQARPTDMLGNDAFTELSMALNICSADNLKTQIKEEYKKFEPTLETVDHPMTGVPTRQPLYCFLDEIQIATRIRMGEFRSYDNAKERPLLRPIWQTMIKILEPSQMLLILSGTAINENSLRDVFTSSIFKLEWYTIKKDIGAFNDPKAQSAYIKHYLPGTQSAARQEFLKRAWGWCRGRYSIFSNPVAKLILTTFLRYRNTAIVIQMVLVNGPYSPHKILDRFVEDSTSFRPTDGENWHAGEPDINNLNIENVIRWHFDDLGV